MSCSRNGCKLGGELLEVGRDEVIVDIAEALEPKGGKLVQHRALVDGIGSGRMTSKAESRSVTTKSRVSPRSKTSRTFPLRSFLIPGRSSEAMDAVCTGKDVNSDQ